MFKSYCLHQSLPVYYNIQKENYSHRLFCYDVLKSKRIILQSKEENEIEIKRDKGAKEQEERYDGSSDRNDNCSIGASDFLCCGNVEVFCKAGEPGWRH